MIKVFGVPMNTIVRRSEQRGNMTVFSNGLAKFNHQLSFSNMYYLEGMSG